MGKASDSIQLQIDRAKEKIEKGVMIDGVLTPLDEQGVNYYNKLITNKEAKLAELLAAGN